MEQSIKKEREGRKKKGEDFKYSLRVFSPSNFKLGFFTHLGFF